MNIIGTVSYESSYYDCKSRKLLVRGWFLSEDGYDEVLVDGRSAKIGIERCDVYERFPMYNMRNAGFIYENIIQEELSIESDCMPVKIEVIKEEKVIFSRTFNIEIRKQTQTNNQVEKILLENNTKKNVSIVFETSMPLFNLKYLIKNVGSYKTPNIGVTGREGIAVLYKKANENDGGWMPVETYSRKYEIQVNLTHMLRVGEKFRVLIYTAMESVVEKICIEIHKNFEFQVIPLKKQFVWLGGVHTYGVGVSATSMKFSNMIQRRFDSSGETFAYLNSGYLTDIYEAITGKNDECLNSEVVVVLEIFIQNKNEEELLKKILRDLLKRCKCVVVWHAQKEGLTKESVDHILNEFRVDKIIYIDFDYLFYEMKEQCTITDKNINDAGNALICMKMLEQIQNFYKKDLKK